MLKRFILLALILLAFGLRATSLDAQSMWRDEVDTLCFATEFWDTLGRALSSTPQDPTPHQPYGVRCQPAPGLSQVDTAAGPVAALRQMLSMSGWNGPLYTLSMSPWISLTGPSDFALRYVSLFFGVLAVPLTCVLGRRLLTEAVGLLGAALVATSPFLIWYSQEAKMYGAILALGLLSLYGLRRAVEGGGARWWAVMVISTSLCLYTHILTALLIPLQFVLWLWWWPHSRHHLKGGVISFGLLTLPYLPLLAWQLPQWLRPSGQATLFSPRPLNDMLWVLVQDWSHGFLGDWTTLVYLPLGALILAGLAWIWLTGEPEEGNPSQSAGRVQLKAGHGNQPAERWREPQALMLWALLPAVLLWLISLRQPLFVSRYLTWAAPGFYLLAAAGAVGLARWHPLGLGLAVGLVGLVLLNNAQAYQAQVTQPYKPDFKAAAAYLEERYQPDELIMFHLSYVETNFDFYYSGEYSGVGAPAPGGEMSPQALDQSMRARLGGHRTVWLVQSQASMWDPGARVKRWLDQHAVSTSEEVIFTHVSLQRYELNVP